MPAALRVLKDGLTRGLELLIIATMALLVVDVVWGVFTRYALGQQAKWRSWVVRLRSEPRPTWVLTTS